MASQKIEMPVYWVATYGSMGLDVQFYPNKRQYDAAVAEAEDDHDNDRIDSYLHGSQIATVTTRVGLK